MVPVTIAARAVWPVLSALLLVWSVRAAELPAVKDIDAQPLWAQARRVMEALELLGNPIPNETKVKLQAAVDKKDGPPRGAAIQDAFDPLCLLGVTINPESRVKAQQGPAAAQLSEQGWRQFLIKVTNQAGITAELKAASPQAARLFNS